MNAGPMAFRLGLRGMPIEAEARIVERDIKRCCGRLSRLRICGRICMCSMSPPVRAIKAIRAAKREGLHVTCEIAPHHFALTEEAVGDYDTRCRR